MRLNDPDHIDPDPGEPLPRPLWTTSVVIYGTLALLALAVPSALASWSKNFEPGRTQHMLVKTAQAVESFSQRLRADAPYRYGRELFLSATRKRED